jgi:anti-sigma factor RsiW
MNQETQLKLQAYLDGELSAAERQSVEALLRGDAGAKSLLAELTYTRAALAVHVAEIKVPESREFYWSKIEREIQREPKAESRPGFSLSGWLRRVLVPAGAVAAMVIAVMLSLPHNSGASDYSTSSNEAATFTYHNYATGTTLVWLDYSSQNDFSDLESDDTLDL